MVQPIELTPDEKHLLDRIDFTSSDSDSHDVTHWRSVGIAAQKLMESLLARQAIPEVRIRIFTDPECYSGGHGRSHKQIFEKNGTRDDDIYRHRHFLKYLHYFLYGPRLPAGVIAAFEKVIGGCGPSVTSSDIAPIGKTARKLARQHTLDTADPPEEFFKLALECGLELNEARFVRKSIR